jgi:hypothetical protein
MVRAYVTPHLLPSKHCVCVDRRVVEIAGITTHPKLHYPFTDLQYAVRSMSLYYDPYSLRSCLD